ncbi:FMN-dependent NADH-azoreductase [Microbacterium rhizophilus]|uniref:FMN-dependent NADH-azoreductase n=1 Tax=Microbacterium rhizophilus TaxID=3138934 RepID=UPI0031EACD8D
MPTLLHLDSSAGGARSVSRALTAEFADAWLAAGPGREVVRRDLQADPPPHLPQADLHWPSELRRGSVDPAAEALQSTLVDELLAADALVIGVPLYNYSMPSTLKAWIDHIHVPGRTTSSTGAPPLAGRPVVLVVARGAIYDPGTPMADADHAVPPLRQILGDALGMDVHVVAVSRTLSDLLPLLHGEADAHRAEAEAARAQLAALARDLG